MGVPVPSALLTHSTLVLLFAEEFVPAPLNLFYRAYRPGVNLQGFLVVLHTYAFNTTSQPSVKWMIISSMGPTQCILTWILFYDFCAWAAFCILYNQFTFYLLPKIQLKFIFIFPETFKKYCLLHMDYKMFRFRNYF